MDILIEAYKENNLENFTMVCQNVLCDRAVNMDVAHLEIYRAPEFDTYVFKCPLCKKILAIEYDYKDEHNKQKGVINGKEKESQL